ncbi:MAG TPA: tetratricopeptide repeat protein [Gaiellaceae bacterium]|nr:tetratricopeptide repeat protein [Gaiellaceae bacterium]
MARAAVKAKQAAAAKAQPPKSRTRGRKRHAGGGNPNQELFFVRLRRHQKWIYAMLAVVFGLTFVLVGVGSGNGNALASIWNNIVGGHGGTSISKAQDEVKTNPAKGYLDLATAYNENSNPGLAIQAYHKYLQVKPKDADTWALVAGQEFSQGNKYQTESQNAQQQAQLADPSAPFLPGGTLGSQIGQNPTYSGASTAASTRTSLLFQKEQGAFTAATTDYQRATKLRPKNPAFLIELAQAAIDSNNAKVAIQALQTYLKVNPDAPNKAAIKREIKALQAQAKVPTTGTPSVSTGNGG